jgi:hypothetical protein
LQAIVLLQVFKYLLPSGAIADVANGVHNFAKKYFPSRYHFLSDMFERFLLKFCDFGGPKRLSEWMIPSLSSILPKQSR